MTTKTDKKPTKVAKDTAADASSTIADGAREFVKRSTDMAQERVEMWHESSKSYNAQVEDTLKRAASGYTNMLAGIADAAFANVNHTLAAVEKLAAAQSVSEAVSIQTEYVREHAQQNLDHLRGAYDYVRETAADGTEAVRENYGKMWKVEDKKAA